MKPCVYFDKSMGSIKSDKLKEEFAMERSYSTIPSWTGGPPHEEVRLL